MTDPITTSLFAALVRRYGGMDATAALMAARFGACSKGTISRMCAGSLAVTIDVAAELEDALGAYPITERLADRCVGRTSTGDLSDLAARANLASAQGVAAVLRAFSEASEDPSRLTLGERAEVITTMREAGRLIDRIIKAAEA